MQEKKKAKKKKKENRVIRSKTENRAYQLLHNNQLSYPFKWTGDIHS